MTKIYFGCDEVSRGWKRYYGLCNALEVPSREKSPSIRTLNTWRVNSPKGFGFILHTEPEVSDNLERLSEKGQSALDETTKQHFQNSIARAHALGAKALFLATSYDFGPTAKNRSLIEELAKIERGNTLLIWETQGMWSVEDTRNFAKSNGIIYAMDPFLANDSEISFGHGDACFKLSERQGARRHFDGYDFEQMLEWGQSFDRLFILLRGRFKWRHARELQETLKSLELL